MRCLYLIECSPWANGSYQAFMFLQKIGVLFLIALLCSGCLHKVEQATESYEGKRYDKSAVWAKKWTFLHPYLSNYGFPLEKVHTLAGNFGEIRSGHFHSGLDIKVDNQIGMPILAAQDGYVFRVNVMPTGYGKVVYLRHLDGYFSVYGHLSRFSDTLESLVKTEQYKQEQFAVDIYFPQTKIWVKKGDIIAYSGNSGSSEAPHLHFEIRDFQDEPVNALPFYQSLLKDTQVPTLSAFAVCPLDSLSAVNENPERQYFIPKKEGNNYTLQEPIFVSGKIGLEYLAFDQMDETNNKFGLYSASLWLDDSLHFQYLLPQFSFEEQKYVHLHTAYEETENYEKCYISAGNKLRAYKAVNQGFIQLKDNKVHQFKLILADIYGNKTLLKGQLENKPLLSPNVLLKDSFYITQLTPNQEFIYKKNDIQLTFPQKSVYRPIPLSIRRYPQTVGLHTAIYQIGHRNIPLDTRYEIRFKLPQPLPTKPVIAYLNGDKWVYLGGKIEKDSFMVAKCRVFGTFAVLSDTISPEIQAINFNNKDICKEKVLKIHISDDFSGIYYRSIRGSIDKKWVLWEYDAKTGTLSHTLDRHLSAGKHEIRLEVSDNVGNKSVFFIFSQFSPNNF